MSENLPSKSVLDYIRPNRVLDVGANIGEFTKQLMVKFPNTEYVMIEPNPSCETALSKLNIPFYIMGLSDEPKIQDLYIENSNNMASGASIYKENTEWYSEGNYHTQRVKLSRLDDCDFFNGRNPDFIKLDTQGSEYDILVGGEETIKKTKWVYIEVSLIEYNKDAPLMNVVVRKMKDLNFYIEDILEYHSFPEFNNGCIFQLDLLFKNSRQELW